MSGWLRVGGCDAIHTLDLPDANRTSDEEVIAFADREGRVVATKDADFVDSHVLFGRPSKLLLVSTGNIRNQDLEPLLMRWIATIILEFGANTFLELGPTGVIVRG